MHHGMRRQRIVDLNAERATSPSLSTTPDKAAQAKKVEELCREYWTREHGPPIYVPAIKREAWNIKSVKTTHVVRAIDGSVYRVSRNYKRLLSVISGPRVTVEERRRREQQREKGKAFKGCE